MMTEFVRVTARNAGPMTLSGTNTYVFGRLVVDPGPEDEEHLAEVVGVVPEGIERILLTHRHSDHSAGAVRLSEITGASVLAFGSGVADGDEFSGLIAIHTPGHAPDHVCYWCPESATLLSGDLISGEGSIIVAPPDGDLEDYMDSLRRVRSLAPERILPGHGPEVADARAKVQEYIDHREEREARVVAALKAGAKTPEEILEVAYTDVPPAMRAQAKRAVEAHLIKLGRTRPAQES